MNSVFRISIVLFGMLLLSLPSYADDFKRDNWFGKDKFEHFTVSAFYAGGIAIVANRHFDMPENDSITLGIGFTVSLGGAKEFYDRSRPGETSSIKDFLWDLGGVVAGGLLASLII